MVRLESVLCLFFYVLCVVNSSLCKNDENSVEQKPNLYGSSPTEVSISVLQEEWSKGDVDAGGELIFAQALGAELEEDLHDVITRSKVLLSVGAVRAHTTLALLLNHNLTEPKLSKENRHNKATSYYVTAAIKGDPVAQIIAGKNYLSQGDCMASLTYYHKAASFAIQKVPEMDISTPSIVRHIWDEDCEVSADAFPTQEQLEFFEYGAYHGESEAALKAASLLITGSHTIQRDLVRGEEYLKQAVKGNDTMAMVYLAQMYLRGLMNGDDLEALELLRTALKYGNNLAHSGLGRMYMEGKAGLQKNLLLAILHLKKGIENGIVDAFYHMGKLLSLNDKFGTPHEATELWKIPASIGHVHSAWCLAEYYHNNLVKSSSQTVLSPDSTNVSTKLCENAVSFYRTVALAGEWQRLFADAFEDYSSGRKGAALMKYLLLSDLGYSAAHINAARILDEGCDDIYTDDLSAKEQAFEMWLRTAQSGNAKGHVRMGDYLYYGIGSKKKDYVGAAEHYRKASLMRNAEGGFSLALVTEWGEGVEQDLQKAEQIYSSLVDISSDAEVPVAMALTRMKFFSLIKDFFFIDLYALNWGVINISEIAVFLKNFSLQWDTCIIILLSVFILVNLHFRFR